MYPAFKWWCSMNEPLIQGGYVIIARQVRKSKLWLSLKSAHRMVLMEILLQAQWQDCDVIRNGEIIHLKRGQVATSYQQIVDDISEKNITIKVVRTAIDKMERALFLAKDEAVQRAKKGLLLTVVKYDFFQNPDNYKGRAEDNDKGEAKAEQGQSEGRARAINKKLKNLNKENKDINTLSRQSKIYAEDSAPFRMASYLHKKIMEHAEISGVAHLVKNYKVQKWADECRKLLELDKVDKDLARLVIDWATNDDFWKTNILSAASLRKKFAELAIKMNGDKPKVVNNNQTAQLIKEAEDRERIGNPKAILGNPEHV